MKTRTKALLGITRHRGWGSTEEAELLEWAAGIPDDAILSWPTIGLDELRWIREHQPPPAVKGAFMAELLRLATQRADMQRELCVRCRYMGWTLVQKNEAEERP